MKTGTHLRSYLAEFSLEWEMLQRRVVEKIKTYILLPIFYFYLFIYLFFENRPVYEMMWSSTVEADKP